MNIETWKSLIRTVIEILEFYVFINLASHFCKIYTTSTWTRDYENITACLSLFSALTEDVGFVICDIVLFFTRLFGCIFNKVRFHKCAHTWLYTRTKYVHVRMGGSQELFRIIWHFLRWFFFFNRLGSAHIIRHVAHLS